MDECHGAPYPVMQGGSGIGGYAEADLVRAEMAQFNATRPFGIAGSR